MRFAFLTAVLTGLVIGNSRAMAQPAAAQPAGAKQRPPQAEPADRGPQGLGQLLVDDPQSGATVRLNLARYHVNVVLQPPVALVQIDQSFYNPYPRNQEGTFVFNLPEGASVSRFAMYTSPTVLVEGELVERRRAANIYQSIVNRQRDPAILEQIGGNLFRMRVFPILAQDTKRILLDFTVPIGDREEGWHAFELPLMSDLDPVWDFAITGTIRGPTVAGTAKSESHSEIKFDAADGGAIKFAFEKRSYRPDAPFVVRFQQKPAEEATIRSYLPAAPPNADAGEAKDKTTQTSASFDRDPTGSARRASLDSQSRSGVALLDDEKPKEPKDEAAAKRQCEFLATISANVLNAGRPKTGLQPADLLILADTSGGMSDRARLRQVVRTIATSLRKGDRFRLGCVDVDFRALSPDWIAAGSPAVEKALARFESEFFLGESDFGVSFASALKSLPAAEAGRRRLVVYVGDGTLPALHMPPAQVQKHVAEPFAQAGARFFSLILDTEPLGLVLMESLAATTGGRIFRSRDFVAQSSRLPQPKPKPGAAGTAAAQPAPTPMRGDFADWLKAGCPNPVKIISAKAEGVPPEDLFVPTAWLPGLALRIFGRCKEAEKLKLEITFERDGQPETREWTLDLKNDPEDMFVGRLWAQKKLDQLRAASAAHPEGERAIPFVQQVVSLSQEWTLLSPYTAFLVLEKEDEYPKYGITRALRHKYWKPEDAVEDQPLSPEAVAALKAPPPVPRKTTSAQFDQALAGARIALAHRAPNRALVLLDKVATSAQAAESAEFKALQETAQKMLARGDMVRNLGPQRAWFDRKKPIGFDSPTTDLVWQLLYGYGAMGRYDDPHLAALAKPVAPPETGTTIEEFGDWLATASGLNVWLDRGALTDEGVDLGQEAAVRGIRLMSIQNIMRHVLESANLTYVFEDDVLKITTSSKAGEKLTTQLYPITDLIQTTRTTDYSLLASSGLDREQLTNRRLQEKLDRKLTVEFDETPLEEVIEFFNDKLDDNVIIHRQTLNDEGVALDQPITLQLKDFPARKILKLVLEPLQLTTVVENEAVLITTTAKGGEKLETRLHSAQGIVYELPPDVARKRRSRPWKGGMGGAGMGMMGGMGGGGFGGGGFVGAGMGGAASVAGNEAVSQLPGDGDTQLSGSGPMNNAPPSETDRLIGEDWLDPPDVQNHAPPGAWPTAIDWQGRFRLPPPTTASDTMNLIQTTIQPESWEELSGPGSMMYFRGALGFVVRQTQPVHDEIGELLDQLRELPPAFGDNSGYFPARLSDIGPNDVNRWDTQSLVHLLTTVIQPDSWEDLSGPGAIFVHVPKLAMSIRQTQDVHRDISRLLTSLRRARYLARQGKTWRSFDIAQGPWFNLALGLTDLSGGARQSALPEPEPEELKALAVLGDPVAGVQTWRSIPADGRAQAITTARNGGARSEFEFEGRLIRVEGDEAAVAYPGLALVERGAWGEAARRLIDGRLPWLPHRSRRELARLFNVKVAAQDSNTVQLQFEIPGAGAGNDLLVTVNRKNGLPTKWESRLDGKPALRLTFADLAQVGNRPIWKTVIATDGAGQEIERWELTSYSELKVELPALDAGWEEFVVLDLREQEKADVPPLIKALQAVRMRDWPAADKALVSALETQPDQPFLLLIKAFALTQRAPPASGGREPAGNAPEPDEAPAVVPLLQTVARNGATELLQHLADRSFSHLTETDLYEILLKQPENRRRVADWDNLARLAARVSKPADAVSHLTKAIEQAGKAEDDAERERFLVEMLLESKRVDEAVARAQARAARAGVPPEELAALAETLHKRGTTGAAETLMRQALRNVSANEERRARLLVRRSGLETGLARWRTILESIDQLSADSPQRAGSVDLLLGELIDPAQADAAGKLAGEAKDKKTQTALRLRQAELLASQPGTQAAEIGWTLYESKQLPENRFEWLFGRLFAARQDERLIRLAEDRLRAGKSLEQGMLDSLATAYDARGQRDFGKRARTNARDIKTPVNYFQPAGAPAGPGGMGGGFFDVR